MNHFDPRYPPTTNSLNRLRLAGPLVPAELQGKTGYELVSTAALSTLIAPHTSDMKAFYQHVADGVEWAVEIGETIGTRLGYLLLALISNDSEMQVANPDKDRRYWAYWSSVTTVYLGGGLMVGNVGEIITTQAHAILATHGSDRRVQVMQSPYPQHLPLLGAARIVTNGQQAIVLDFGGSFVKRAIAHYSATGLRHLQLLASLPSDFPDNRDDAALIFDRMVDIIVTSATAVDAPTIPISIAAYVDEQGQPLLSQGGIYMQLARLTPNVPSAFSQAVSQRLGRTVAIKLLHDGTAAALYYAPLDRAAVIMIGTALGSGYPVLRDNLPLCSVSPELTVAETD